MAIAADTWAVVAATGLGPILAVGVSILRDNVASLRNRRLHVFRTLMATRKIAISNEHVGALNLVEVDFYGCAKVQTAWSNYKRHLDTRTAPTEGAAWDEGRERLLAQLLFEIASVLRFNIPALEIFKGGYAPQAWSDRESRANAALEYVLEIAKDSKPVPIWIKGATPQPPSPPPPLQTF